MRKNIEIINADAPLIEWAVETLSKSTEKPKGSDELIRGISGLLEDEEASLMIEQGSFSAYSQERRKITCGDLTIFISSRKVTRAGEEISLTPKEFDIL